MKFKLFTFIAVLAASAAALTAFNSCNAQEKKENIMPNDKKVLIAYYSLSGNTKDVAEAIRSKTGGDIFRIETVQSYPEEYRATDGRCRIFRTNPVGTPEQQIYLLGAVTTSGRRVFAGYYQQSTSHPSVCRKRTYHQGSRFSGHLLHRQRPYVSNEQSWQSDQYFYGG